MKIIVEQQIENVCPRFVGACVEAEVENSPYSEELWKVIDRQGEQFRQLFTTQTVKDISAIAATRSVYIRRAVRIRRAIARRQRR